MHSRRSRAAIVTVLALVAGAIGLTPPAQAASGTGTYGSWSTPAGSPPSSTATFPGTSFPSVTAAAEAAGVDKTATLSVASSTTLTGTTPFGQRFGTSSKQKYLSIGGPSSTGQTAEVTLTFSPAAPTRWAFALGDVDAEKVAVTATGPGGALTAAQLGWQGSFNYASASGPLPTWNAGTQELTGSGNNTDGETGWFSPTVPVTSITLRQTSLTGFPTYQLWVATDDTEPTPYTVSYNANGGTGGPAGGLVLEGATYAIPATEPTRVGHTFGGWNTALDGTGTSYAAGASFTMPAADVALFAQWTPKTFPVTYSGNTSTGGTAPTSPNVAYGGTLTVAERGDLVKSSHWFAGWNTQPDGKGDSYAPGAAVTVLDGLTLYAQWVSSEFDLAYNANGGTGAPASETRTAGATAALSSAQPTRTGYTFGSWNTAADGGGTSYAAGANYTMPAQDTVLYAKWTAVDYTLGYDARGGSPAPSTQTGTYLQVLTVNATAPTRAGYTFTGWNTAADGTGATYAPGGWLRMPAANVTLYATWLADEYQVAYDGNGGENPPASSTAATGSTVTVSSQAPTRAGYHFQGWTTQADGSGTRYQAGGTFTMPPNDVTLYAQWATTPAPGPAPTPTPTPTPESTATPTPQPEQPTAPTEPQPAPDDTRVTTRPDTPVTITPLADQAPPPGQAWDYASMRLVDPQTGQPATTATTAQGSWVLGPKPGVVTFTPATRFTGTASIEYRIASTGGTAFAATIYATVTNRRIATATATVYFASGSAVLTEQAKATLDALVRRVDRRAARVLFGETVGYVQATTFTGNDISLSTARARNIKQYLVGKGIRPITTPEGLGRAQEPGATARRATATITYTPRN